MVASLVVFWTALVMKNEGCPEYTIIEELQVDYFMGRWYEQYSSVEGDGNCGMLDITVGSPTFMNVSQSYKNLSDGSISEKNGRIRWP
jgi:hypothetical protein